MNMYKCVRVSLVLLKGNWQLWKLRASLCQQSAVEESSPGKACSDPLGCALWAAPESGGEDGAQVWTHLRPSQVEGILQACVQWMPNTFKKCAWVLHVGACLLPQSQDAIRTILHSVIFEGEQCVCFYEEEWKGGKHLLAPSTDVPLFF